MAKRFVKMSVDVLARKDLSLAAKVVLGVIVDHMRGNSSCWPGVRRLCKATSLTDKTIDRAVRELEAAGQLVVDRPGAGRANVYSNPELASEQRRRGSDAVSAGRTTTLSAGEVPTLSTQKAPEFCPKAPEFCPASAGETPAEAPERLRHNRQTKKQTKKQTAACAKKPRPKNELWDAVVSEWFADGVPDSQKTNVGRLVKEFRQLGATPSEIRIRRKRIRDCWGPGKDTPASTLKHWSEFSNEQKPRNDRPGRETAAPGKYAANASRAL